MAKNKNKKTTFKKKAAPKKKPAPKKVPPKKKVYLKKKETPIIPLPEIVEPIPEIIQDQIPPPNDTTTSRKLPLT
jgi:hypothetical protein